MRSRNKNSYKLLFLLFWYKVFFSLEWIILCTIFYPIKIKWEVSFVETDAWSKNRKDVFHQQRLPADKIKIALGLLLWSERKRRLYPNRGVLAKRKPGINKYVEFCTVFLLEHKGQPQTVIISEFPSIRQTGNTCHKSLLSNKACHGKPPPLANRKDHVSVSLSQINEISTFALPLY